MTGTILERIVATKRAEVDAARRRRPPADLRAAVRDMPVPRDLYGVLTTPGDRIRLIAEIKKASPSAGLIRPGFDPVAIARTYEQSGAAALSVLTDAEYFQGRLSFLGDVKKAVSLPVLRKDFIIDAYQVYESRAAGADAVLLIAEILQPSQIAEFGSLAAEMGMASLIEIHDAAQLDAVRDLVGPSRRTLLAINNRDLQTQTTDLETTERLVAGIGEPLPFVAESGIKSSGDVERMQRAGAVAVLIGEVFMRADDIASKVRELFPPV